MKIMQSFTLRLSFFALILLFTIYGCNTTNNATATKASDSNLKPVITQADAEDAKPGKPQSRPAEHHEEAVTDKQSELDSKKQDIERLQKRLGGFLVGHGRGSENVPEDRDTTTKKSTENLTAKSDEIEDRPFIELERKLYGNWINKKETESYEFHDDGTVLINVTGQRGKSYKLNGNYKLVGEERIKIDFSGDPLAGQMPPSYFKISISANDFTLTDEPKGPDEPDGPSTRYNRIN
ncbi:MAG: hypothetical protein ACE5H1_11785 [Thermodesulfobacteriota bacterium]